MAKSTKTLKANRWPNNLTDAEIDALYHRLRDGREAEYDTAWRDLCRSIAVQQAPANDPPYTPHPVLEDFYPIDPTAPITDEQLHAVFRGDWGALRDIARLARPETDQSELGKDKTIPNS